MASLQSTTITGSVVAGNEHSGVGTNSQSSIIGGCNHYIQSDSSVIVGGRNNKICYNSHRSVILGGDCTCIAGNSCYGVMIGGYCSSMCADYGYSISTHCTYSDSIYGGVLGGYENSLGPSLYSAIIQGKGVTEKRDCFITTGVVNRTTSIDTANSQMFIEKVYVQGGTDVGSVQGNYVHYGNRGIVGGGTAGAYCNTIDQITISTPGNATDFGDLTITRNSLSATSNGVKGVFAGGYQSIYCNTIDQITISTPGNATDFGDLTAARRGIGATSNGVKGVFAGGYSYNYCNIIEQITISTPGNATDFGDLTISRDSVTMTTGD